MNLPTTRVVAGVGMKLSTTEILRVEDVCVCFLFKEDACAERARKKDRTRASLARERNVADTYTFARYVLREQQQQKVIAAKTRVPSLKRSAFLK